MGSVSYFNSWKGQLYSLHFTSRMVHILQAPESVSPNLKLLKREVIFLDHLVKSY